MRMALDEGDPSGAIAKLDQQMGVKSADELPSDTSGNAALLVLDRASLQQALDRTDASERDYQTADKAIDMLDLARNAGDTIGEYVFSGASGKYVAPPYEKLLINTLNLANYLREGDLNGARVEARRLSVIDRYLSDDLHEGDNQVLAVGAELAGFAFEKSGEPDEALRYYDEALRLGPIPSLDAPVRDLLARSSFSTPRLRDAAAAAPPVQQSDANDADLLLVIAYGRVPHKVAQRVPIGLALTWMSGALSPYDVDRANRLAAQGLVTWVNYPTLGRERGAYGLPACEVDGRAVAIDRPVNVTAEVRKEWKKVEGRVILSAITRMISRYAAGKVVHEAAGRGSLLGALLDLGTQATLTALDTPDTRSWETLPARIAVVRVKVPPGRHDVIFGAHGAWRTLEAQIPAQRYQVRYLMDLQ